MIIVGLRWNSSLLVFIGLFFESMIRPTTVVFIPAVVLVYFFSERDLKNFFIKSGIAVVSLITGLAVTISVHYYFTEKWFIFFDAQKLWKNYLHFPHLPLTSWGGDAILRFDASAVAISIVCIWYVFKVINEKTNNQPYRISTELLFSSFYIIGIVILTLSFRDGDLYSLNRFIYATPFTAVVLYYFFENYKFKWSHVWLVAISSELFWLLCGSFNHIHNFLLFSTVSFYFVVLLFTKYENKTISFFSYLFLIVLNLYGLLKLFYKFLNNEWVG
jgi:hypothetical protein